MVHADCSNPLSLARLDQWTLPQETLLRSDWWRRVRIWVGSEYTQWSRPCECDWCIMQSNIQKRQSEGRFLCYCLLWTIQPAIRRCTIQNLFKIELFEIGPFESGPFESGPFKIRTFAPLSAKTGFLISG